ncbi:hypothetical protein, partial [Streptomyces pharetrae]|uniref:hypothetical protein n=1 Tax=Streptomyces pharetrae TaxID=291370 RepID=UPI00296FB36D
HEDIRAGTRIAVNRPPRVVDVPQKCHTITRGLLNFLSKALEGTVPQARRRPSCDDYALGRRRPAVVPAPARPVRTGLR